MPRNGTPKGAFLGDHTRNSNSDPYPGLQDTAGTVAKAIRRIALITLRRAICERAPYSAPPICSISTDRVARIIVAQNASRV